jgi:uncharacterized protein DUF2213
MSRVHRRDRLTVDLARARPVPGSPGMVDAPGHLPIIGTFDYPEFGTVEYVPPETAHDPASLATLRGIPLTIDHPVGMVDAENWRDLAHGVVIDYAPTEDGVDVWVRVASKDAVDAGKGGLVQLSLGYDCQVDEAPGVDAAGKPYTGVQRGRVYNHLAQVGLARVGGGARLRFDAMKHAKLTHAGKTFQIAALLATALKGEALDKDPAKRKDAAIETAEISIDGVTMILPRAVVDQIVAMLSGQAPGAAPEPQVDEAPVPADPTKVDPNAPPRMDGKPITRAELAQLVGAEVERRLAHHDGQTRQRLEVERAAGEILGPTFDYGSADTWEIAAAAIGHVDSAGKAAAEALALKARKGDQLAAGRLLGRFDGVVSQWQAQYDGGGELAIAIDEGRRADGETRQREDADEGGAEAARQRMLARMTKDRAAPKTRAQDDDEAAAE